MASLQKLWHAVAPGVRGLGRTMDSLGASLEAVQVVEVAKPSTRAMPYQGAVPDTDGAVFVAPTASVIGDVSLGAGSSVWYGAKVRGDVHTIKIGANSSIGDCSMVHAAKIQSNHSTTIGDNVSVGANAVVHACVIGDNVLVGDGAQVLDGATVNAWSVIAPGAVVGPGKQVGSGELWSGCPAKMLRLLTDDEKDAIPAAAQEAALMAAVHQDECRKDYLEVLRDEEDATDLEERNIEYFPRTDPAMADVPIMFGGTKPHVYSLNDRKPTQFDK